MADPEVPQLALRLAERICVEPRLTEDCDGARSSARDRFRATQKAVHANDREGLAEIFKRDAADRGLIMFASMHLDVCDGCTRHAQILADAGRALFDAALDWYGFYANLRGVHSVAEQMAISLTSYRTELLLAAEQHAQALID